ncbi:MAG: type IV pili methyl-accepting chemotaxis transducer N-terminal domain-containing protein [Bacteroidota bacterium]
MINNGKSLERSTFRRLTRLYIIALSAIALSIIISQILIQRHLLSQVSDSRVVNVAGRQRMLSQKLVKEALLLSTASLKLSNSKNQLESDTRKNQLQQTLEEWQNAHQWLQTGEDSAGLPGNNSLTIKAMFADIDSTFQNMVKHTNIILSQNANEQARSDSIINQSFKVLLQNEPFFLKHMNRIVFQFDEEASARVKQLRRTEVWLFLLALGIIITELIFIFRPTALRMRDLIRNLTNAEARAQELVKEKDVLYQNKEQSLKELQTLNFALDQAALFASVTTNGQVLYLSKKFTELLGKAETNAQENISELLSSNEGEQEYLKELIQTSRSTIWSGEVKSTTHKGAEIWLEMSIIPVNRQGVQQDVLIICSDITTRKNAQAEIDQLKESHFQQQIQQQKMRSSQVVEAQEEERKRIARDLHDGIGQMLVALKYNLQAIDLKKPAKAEIKLKQINELAGGLIRGMRIATFNLTPPELTDYGIATALAKMAEELSKLSQQNILFQNRNNFNGRFTTTIETNLYRISQEAVNNAIKYAQSKYILITLSHSSDLLGIVIDDDGIGFDMDTLQETHPSEEGTGMGISFMQERVHFINGRLYINAKKGQGTRITVNMPMDELL